MQVREAGALPLGGAQDLSPGYQEQSQGDRLLQKSWGERSWEATCPDSRWGWLEPQEDVGGPQVGVSPQGPASESGGGGVTGRPLRGGTGGPASRRAPLPRQPPPPPTCTSWSRWSIPRKRWVGQDIRVLLWPLYLLTPQGLWTSLWPVVGLAGLLRLGLRVSGESLLGGFHPSGWSPGLGSLLQAQRSKLVAFSSPFAPSSARNQVGGRLQMPF